MSRPLDNAAPTIFATQKAHRAEGVWSEAYDAYDVYDSEGSGSGSADEGEGEEIDAQEVFGEYMTAAGDRDDPERREGSERGRGQGGGRGGARRSESTSSPPRPAYSSVPHLSHVLTPPFLTLHTLPRPNPAHLIHAATPFLPARSFPLTQTSSAPSPTPSTPSRSSNYAS